MALKLFKILPLTAMLVLVLSEIQPTKSDKFPAPTLTRTQLKVSRSLNPEDTQTLNVMTRDGAVAQLIVKKRDPKSSTYDNLQSLNLQQRGNLDDRHVSRAIYTNWIPISSLYYQPSSSTTNVIRLNTIAVTRNETNPPNKRERNNIIRDSDTIPHVPKPVTIRSDNMFVQNSDTKRARSVMQVDGDGIPVIHGVRMPDDDSDRQTWRNARVINGELVPYEKGYQPPAAVPLGELIYANPSAAATTEKTEDNLDLADGIGPFMKQDNFNNGGGPFTIQDNNPTKDNKDFISNFDNYQTPSASSSFGPYTKADNAKITNSKLIDYIKEINAKESKRDYFTRRKYRSYEEQNPPQQQEIQRRMLHYPGQNSYPNSLLYTPSSTSTKLSPVTSFTEGVRTPVLQYAHPELGVQPAKATSDEDAFKANQDYSTGASTTNNNMDSGRQSSPYYENSIDYYRKDVMNYPYNTYYIKPKPEQPFWFRITESIKDNVQNSFARMQQFTRPVFEPIVEATHKISHNLGFSPVPPQQQQAQNKVGFIAPMGAGSVILPALGLVAGGAALGLGAAAVGRFLNPMELRSFHHNPNDIVVIMEEPPQTKNDVEDEAHKRYRRSIINDYYMQQLTDTVMASKDDYLSGLTAPHFWSDTPCAKKLFCRVMLYQNEDEVVLMEKKMDSLMSRVHPAVANSVSHHLEEVMEAVKIGDCSKFVCNRRLPFPAQAA